TRSFPRVRRHSPANVGPTPIDRTAGGSARLPLRFGSGRRAGHLSPTTVERTLERWPPAISSLGSFAGESSPVRGARRCHQIRSLRDRAPDRPRRRRPDDEGGAAMREPRRPRPSPLSGAGAAAAASYLGSCRPSAVLNRNLGGAAGHHEQTTPRQFGSGVLRWALLPPPSMVPSTALMPCAPFAFAVL
ncbi:MAG: hypothetical protein QOF87_3747, partial [Pseudonocardiales bacterium]|nr:hypothetical protein [Pseudonocardiales bacterium]